MTASFPYRLVGPIGTEGTLGLIVLQADETIEQEFRRLFPRPEVALYVSRIPSGTEITPDTFAEMETELPRAAALFPRAAEIDVTGYACTSGTTLIGADRVAALVAASVRTGAVTDPLTAAFAAFEARGFSVPATLSFGERIEARVARIDPASIRAAALEVGARPDVEAVFLSCTNLRTLDIIDGLEDSLRCPVVSSNLALAWQMARLAGAALSPEAPGRLLRR